MLAGRKDERMEDMVIHGAEKADFPIFTPYYELTDEQRQMLWEGTPYFEASTPSSRWCRKISTRYNTV